MMPALINSDGSKKGQIEAEVSLQATERPLHSVFVPKGTANCRQHP